MYDNNKIERPKSYSLRSVAKFLNIKIEEQKHDALEDARITFECFKNYFNQVDQFKVD